MFFVSYNCPLCQCSAKAFYKDEFFLCTQCKGIFRPRHNNPTLTEEKKRYERHENDVNDVGYQRFVSPITTAILQRFSSHHNGLDFGAGTGPVVSKLLQENRYDIVQYDPFFHNHPDLLQKKYDYIVCCEVIEHFHNPKKEFKLLKNLLKSNGVLYCMTHLYESSIDFSGWYYQKDPTHVFIYQKKTITWIQQHFHFKAVSFKDRLIIFNK